jgi:hypothetical protein
LGQVASGDPARQQVVGVFGEVVPYEYVEPVAVTPQVGIRECHQLTVPCRRGVLGRPDEEARLPVDECGRDEQGRRDRGGGLVEDLRTGEAIATDQTVEKVGGVLIRHRNTVRRSADDALTLR